MKIENPKKSNSYFIMFGNHFWIDFTTIFNTFLYFTEISVNVKFWTTFFRQILYDTDLISSK